MTQPHEAAEARAFWIVAPGRGELRHEPLPASPREGEVRIRTLYTAISRGTESLVFRGAVPPSEYRRMRAPFQAGDFPFPVKYGYSNVGRIEAGPADRVGQLVFSLYPHQTRFDLDLAATHRLPATVPPRRAVLAANVETALNACWDLQALPGDRISIVGGGVVGLLVAWLVARIPGTEVEVVDVEPSRAAIAQAFGARFALPAQARGEADRVVHASGRPEGLATALALAGVEATVLELSWYGDRAVTLALGEAFHSRRLTLRSSQVGSLPPAQRPRWNPARRLALALSLLAEPALDCLLTADAGIDALPAVLERLATTPAPEVLCQVIRHEGAG